MTATELYELVKPLIGTGCEPEGLKYHDTICEWQHDDCHDRYDCVTFPVPAAAAMWEVAIYKLPAITGTTKMDWNNHHMAAYVMGDQYLGATGPTRLHALVEAAKKVMNV